MFIEVHRFLLSSNACEDDEQNTILPNEVNYMFNLKDFNGTLVPEPYIANSFDELQHQLLKEIAFYGSGFGWSTTSNEAEEHHILFPYLKKRVMNLQKVTLIA